MRVGNRWCRCFLNFYPGEIELAEKFAERVTEVLEGEYVCMASLQNHFIKNRKSNAEVASSSFFETGCVCEAY